MTFDIDCMRNIFYKIQTKTMRLEERDGRRLRSINHPQKKAKKNRAFLVPLNKLTKALKLPQNIFVPAALQLDEHPY